VIRAISTSKEGLLAFSSFAKKVMRRKEDAERAREVEGILSPVTYDPG